MSAAAATHAPDLSAVAFQLSAALERYQMHVDALSDPWSQRQQYGQVSRAFDEVRMLKGALPELSVDMVEVLISHVELMKQLWLSGAAPESRSDELLQRLRGKHRAAVSLMREHSLRVFSRQ
jgi:hypothetical protein